MIAEAMFERALDPMTTIPVPIRKMMWENDDTFTLTLEVSDVQDFSFRPGQFNMLYVFGMGEAAISISSNPSQHGTVGPTVYAPLPRCVECSAFRERPSPVCRRKRAFAARTTDVEDRTSCAKL